MRLWHKDLIPVLPRQQLLGQWRECCCIARNIAINGTPNHILVNKVMNYPLEHFFAYGLAVVHEMIRREYKCDWTKFAKYMSNHSSNLPKYDELFDDWHNDRYLKQCYYNLQEKYDCGGISWEEWREIVVKFESYI